MIRCKIRRSAETGIADIWLEDYRNKSYNDEKMLSVKYYDLIVESKGSVLNAFI